MNEIEQSKGIEVLDVREQEKQMEKYIEDNLGFDENINLEGAFDKNLMEQSVDTLPHKYEPRDYQMPFWDMFNYSEEHGCIIEDKHRWIIKENFKRMILVWHRRAGKDMDSWQRFLFIAATRPGLYWYMLPTSVQGRKVIFEGFDNEQNRFIDYLPKSFIHPKCFAAGVTTGWNKQSMSTTLKNGSVIQIVGSDNYDRLVGANPSGVVFSEYSICDPNSWEYIRPMLTFNGGFAWFIYTPRGKNHGYNLYSNFKDDEDWTVSRLTYKDTGLITDKEAEKERKGMSDEKFHSEFLADFDAPVEGSYYSKQIIDMYNENRYKAFNIEQGYPVKVAMDIGTSDYTTMVFFQLIRGEIKIIHYYENNNEAADHYIQYIRKFEVLSNLFIDEIILPHDIKKREFTTNKTILNHLEEKCQTKLLTVLQKTDRQSGINNARNVLPSCVFFKDEHNKFAKDKTKEGTLLLIQRLGSYTREFDKKRNVFKDTPVHDQNSHAADSFRYMAMTIDTSRLGVKTYQIQKKGLRD